VRRLLAAGGAAILLFVSQSGVASAAPPAERPGSSQSANSNSNGNGGKSDEAHARIDERKAEKDATVTTAPPATTVAPADTPTTTQSEAGASATELSSSQGPPAAPDKAGSPVDVKKVDPPGNNGTIKLDRIPFDDHPNNQPHVGCTFQVDFYGFDEGQLYADVRFELQSPTKDGRIIVNGNVRPFIGEDDHSGGGSEAGLDASETYVLEFVGVTPHPQQGVHVKLTINADGSQGADVKHKVFWVQGCGEQPPPPPPPVEKCPDGSDMPTDRKCPTPPEKCPDGKPKPCPEPPTDVCPQDGIQTSMDECPPVIEEVPVVVESVVVLQGEFLTTALTPEIDGITFQRELIQPIGIEQLPKTGSIFDPIPLTLGAIFLVIAGGIAIIASRRPSTQH
jgi:LPXTG-motif cell wall-anchored protein